MALTLTYSSPAAATNHTAGRSFSETSVMPGGEIVVTITAAGYGVFAQVVEMLPAGFSFVDSSLEEGVEIEGQTVSFILLGEETFTYTVTAPPVERRYTFSGVLKDWDRLEVEIGGASEVTVGATPSAHAVPAASADLGAAGCPNRHAHSDPGAHGCPNRHAHSDPGANAYPNRHTRADTCPHACPNRRAHSDPGANRHARADTCPHACPNRHTCANPGAHGCPNRHARADPGAYGCPDRHAHA